MWQQSDAPGLAVAVAQDGEVIWSAGFGFADRERRIPATAETEFRIGSVSKLLTAAGVALLAQEGKLDLDAAARSYVPEFPDKGYALSTRQLAGHLGGIRHYRWDETRPSEPCDGVIAALDLFKDDPLEFRPGTRFSYSSYGWVLVSAVVERAAGLPYLEFMHRRIFEPLGMSGTHVESEAREPGRRSLLYQDGKPVDPDELGCIWAAGGFRSTALDLARFGSTVLPGSALFTPATLDAIFTAQRTSGGEPVPVGIGWFVDQLADGSPVYHHPGTVKGGQAVLFINPRERLVVAMLANQPGRFGPGDCQRIACYLLDRRDCPELLEESRRQATKATQVPALLALLSAWEEAMERGSLEEVLATLSADFSSTVWRGRSDLEASLTAGIEIDAEDIHLRSAGWDLGAVVRVEDVGMGRDPAIPLVIEVVRERAGWRILRIAEDS